MPELKRQADRLGVPVVALSVRLVLDRLKTTCHDDDDEAKVANGVKRVLLPSCQRVCVSGCLVGPVDASQEKSILSSHKMSTILYVEYVCATIVREQM